MQDVINNLHLAAVANQQAAEALTNLYTGAARASAPSSGNGGLEPAVAQRVGELAANRGVIVVIDGMGDHDAAEAIRQQARAAGVAVRLYSVRTGQPLG
jgi:hypothetical protein